MHTYKNIRKLAQQLNVGRIWTLAVVVVVVVVVPFFLLTITDRKKNIFVTEDKQRCHHSYSCFSAWWILFYLKNISQRAYIYIYIYSKWQRTHTKQLTNDSGIMGIIPLLLYLFFNVYSRCCRPWLHYCELCAHLSYGFIICCSLFNTGTTMKKKMRCLVYKCTHTHIHNWKLFLMLISITWSILYYLFVAGFFFFRI